MYPLIFKYHTVISISLTANEPNSFAIEHNNTNTGILKCILRFLTSDAAKLTKKVTKTRMPNTVLRVKY